MYLEDAILRSKIPGTQFKMVINKKFYINIVPSKFHKNCYRNILRKYMNLPIEEGFCLYNDKKTRKFYIESDKLERDLLEFEDAWYNRHK